MKDSIKQSIIRFVESQGEASKTAICDHVRDLHGTTGDCVARRMREMVADGILIKDKKEYEGKKYFAYRVKPLEEYQMDEIQEDTTSMEEKLEQIYKRSEEH